MGRILLHMCCGPCAVKCIDSLRDDGHEVYGLFFNPNIHPYTEYTKRLESTKKVCDEKKVPLITIDEYRLEEFLRNSVFRENKRCEICYSMRIKRGMSAAKKGNFDAFTTTLLISPYQNHNLISDICSTESNNYGIDFYYKDFRNLFKEGHKEAREMNLYMQQYCGCIYSEADRYVPKKKRMLNK